LGAHGDGLRGGREGATPLIIRNSFESVQAALEAALDAGARRRLTDLDDPGVVWLEHGRPGVTEQLIAEHPRIRRPGDMEDECAAAFRHDKCRRSSRPLEIVEGIAHEPLEPFVGR
jgi:hypothetical protein